MVFYFQFFFFCFWLCCHELMISFMSVILYQWKLIFFIREYSNLKMMESWILEQFEVDGIGVFEGITKEMMVQKSIPGKMSYKLPYKDISKKTPLFDNNKAHCLELPCPIAYCCFLHPVSFLFLCLDFSVTNQIFFYEP